MRRLSFILCECCAHGTFRNAQGEEGPDVASKEMALKELDGMVRSGRLSTGAAMDLLAKTRRSGMAERESDVPEPLKRKVRDWTLMRASANGRLPFSSFHVTLDEPGPV